MINFEKHIREVLYEYDFVVIPNFGAFIANFEVVDSIPYKTFSFNHLLKSDENHKFLNYLVRVEKKPLSDIELQWNNFLLDLKKSLNKNKRFEINGVGSVIQNDGEAINIQFYEGNNFYERDSFDLEKEELIVPSIVPQIENFELEVDENYEEIESADEVVQEVAPSITYENQNETVQSVDEQWYEEEKPVWKKLGWLIPLLLLVAAGAFYLWKNQAKLNLNGTEKVVTDSTYLEETILDSLDMMESDSSNIVSDEVDSLIETAPEIEEKPQVKEIKKTTSKAKYHVWAGLFKSKSNADKLLRKLRNNGLNAEIQLAKSMRRVYVPVNTEEEAKSTVKKIEQLTGDKAVYFEID